MMFGYFGTLFCVQINLKQNFYKNILNLTQNVLPILGNSTRKKKRDKFKVWLSESLFKEA